MKLGELARLTALLLALLAAFAIGARQLNVDSIWTDELYSLANMGGFDAPYSPAQIVDSLATHSPQHTPLFYVIGAAWAQLAGWTQFAMRAISLFAGLLFIAWLYRLGADVFGAGVGLTAAWLAATSVFLALSLHEIRMYTLMLLLAAMHVCAYWRLAYGRGGKFASVCFVLTAAALLYTHMFSAIALGALGLHHLLFALRNRRGKQILSGWLAALVLFLPYVPVVYEGFLEETTKPSTVRAASDAPELLATLAALLGNGSAWLLAGLGLLLLWRLRRLRSRVGLRWLAFALLMLAALLLFNQQFRLIGLYRSRYLLILWLPCLPLIAYAIAAGLSKPHVAIACLLLWSAVGWQFQRSGDFVHYIGGMVYARWYPNLQPVVEALRGKAQPQDFLLGFTGSEHINSERKHGVSVADWYTQAQLGIDGAFLNGSLAGAELLDALEARIASHPFLLLVYDKRAEPANLPATFAALQSDYRACDIVVDSATLFVQRWVDDALTCARQHQPIAYDNGIGIVDRYAEYAPDSDSVRIVTGWDVPDAAMLQQYNVSLQIVTPDWRNLAQSDRHLYANVLKWYEAELSTAALPPGDYRVMVILYERQTLQKAAGVDLVSRQSSDIFPILAFKVGA